MHKSKNLSSYYISTEFGSPKFVKSDLLAAVDSKTLTSKNLISPNNYVISLGKEKKGYEFPLDQDGIGTLTNLNPNSTKNLKVSLDPKAISSVREGISELNQKMKQIQTDKSLSGLFGTKKMKPHIKNRSIMLDEFAMSINDKITGAFRRHDPITNQILRPARSSVAIKANLKKVAAENIIKKVSSIPRIRNSPDKLAQIQAINEGKQILTLETSSKYIKNQGSTGILSPSNILTSAAQSPDNLENQLKNKLISVISSDVGAVRTNPGTPSGLKSLNLMDALKDSQDFKIMPSTQQYRTSPKIQSSEREEKFLPGKRKRANQDERDKLDRFLHDQFVIDLIAKNRDKKPEEEHENYLTLPELQKLITEKKSVNETSEFALPEYNFLEEFKKKADNNPIYSSEQLEIPKGFQKTKGFEIFQPENTCYRDVAKSTALATNRFENVGEVIETAPKFSRSPKSKKTTILGDVTLRRGSPRKTIVLKPGEQAPKQQEKLSIFQKLGSKRLKKIRKAIKEKFKAWAKINIPENQRRFEILPKLIAGNLFTPKPYEHPGSQEFFQAIKIGDWPRVQLKLRSDRFLIYDYDHMGQTALHWAVKRGHTLLVDRLLYYGAEIDSKDVVGKTPLYFAIKTGNVDLVKVLLFNRASPHNDKIDYMSVCKDGRISKVIAKAKQLNVVLNFYKPEDQKKVWQKRAQELFDADKVDDHLIVEKKEL